MATCLSLGSKRKRKNKILNAYTKINGVYDRNIQHEIEEYEWLQQQKILMTRAQLKPTQYVILSQKEIHDTIEKTLNKYPQSQVHWHWMHDRFEPVIICDEAWRNINNATDEMNHDKTRVHNHHNYVHDIHETQHDLLRMNGNILSKCSHCFRGNMTSEYMTQNDLLYLIKYALKLFIEHRTSSKHNCLWRQMINCYDDDEINRFHSNFKYCKPLISNINSNNDEITATKEHISMDGDIVLRLNEHSMISLTNNSATNTTTHLHNYHPKKEEADCDYFVPQQYQQHNEKKKKKKKKKKELKHELHAIKENYHLMLKDYNKLQNFLSRKGIYYDAQKENQVNHTNDPYSTSINSNIRNLDSLQSENERLWIELERIQNDKRRLEEKYALSQNEQMRLKSENIELKSQINAFQEEMHSNTSSVAILAIDDIINEDYDDDDEQNMIQRIFEDDNNNDDFYFELMTLYDMKYDDDDDDLTSFALAALQKEEDVIAENEFNLFRLLIDDRYDEETVFLNDTIKAMRGSAINVNYGGIDALLDYVSSSQFDIHSLCNFLPLILFKTSKFEKEIKSKSSTNDTKSSTNYAFLLISRLSKQNRLINDENVYHDIAQKLLFLSHSYRNSSKISEIFTNSYKIWTKHKQHKHAQDDDDVVDFWCNILNYGYEEGEEIKIDHKEKQYRDPVCSQLASICGVKICKELKSANKPILCELSVGEKGDISSHIILKKGDDLRKDYAMISIFKFMNYIWKKEGDLGHFKHLSFGGSIVKILTFAVQPFTNDIGAIQLIKNCVALRHAQRLAHNMKEEHFYQLITSAAASYIASFVCGVRDRHFENILIRVADCTLFHIDFGYCCGETIKFAIDASPFGITETLKDLMNYHGDDLYKTKFIPSCCDSYLALRKNYKPLIKFAQLAFTSVKKENEIESFIKARLKIFDNKKNSKWNNTQFVRKWLTKQLMMQPKCNKTRTKNKIRKFLSPTMIDLDQKLNLS